MIGRRLWIGIPDPEISPETSRHLLQIDPGGVILFGRNVTSRARLTDLVTELRALLGSHLRICIDQEGGRVVRIPEGVTIFPGNLSLGAAACNDRSRALALARLQGQISGQELHQIGIDVNLAPCVDLIERSEARGIGSRSFGSDAALALVLATEIGSGHRQYGVHDCWKHYPGIGSVKVDPHHGLPRLESQVSETHLLPFAGASAAGASMVMTTHVVAERLDPIHPVTTSAAAVSYLREDLGYRGVVITDCLEMGGVAGIDFEQVIRGAAAAGHDALLVSHTPARQLEALRVLERLIDAEQDSQEQHQQSLTRLDSLSRIVVEHPIAPLHGESVALEIARCGTTLLAGPAATLSGSTRGLLVLPQLHTTSPVEDPLQGLQLNLLEEELGDGVETLSIDAEPSREQIERVLTTARGVAETILVLKGFRHSTAARSLVEELATQQHRLIIVLLEDPRDLVAIPAAAGISVITAHGCRAVHQQAIADVLLGRITPSDHSPMK
ncbi:MAG: glycoside hydrolase family 3 N-terminal domain-containing protein [Planctomycetota bacterium]|nr:glycoside hydrolase family 3 N-terminal domain-containing protein [Planctomycetota bacterium]